MVTVQDYSRDVEFEFGGYRYQLRFKMWLRQHDPGEVVCQLCQGKAAATYSYTIEGELVLVVNLDTDTELKLNSPRVGAIRKALMQTPFFQFVFCDGCYYDDALDEAERRSWKE